LVSEVDAGIEEVFNSDVHVFLRASLFFAGRTGKTSESCDRQFWVLPHPNPAGSVGVEGSLNLTKGSQASGKDRANTP
jgi:uncharacterized protein YbbC (DUF1343 family)